MNIRAKTGEAGGTLIVGMGLSGLSCARFLSARGIPVAVTDSRVQPPALAALRGELPGAALFPGGFPPEVFDRARRLVVSPGISLEEPLIRTARERGAEVLGDIELFAREAKAPVAAVTGSNGKSTVTTLLGEMARRARRRVAVGGNLGPPALELLDSEVELYVLELSSFQLETTVSLAPEAAVVLNLSPDHLDRYRDMAHYAGVKASVYRQARHRVFNRDDPRVKAMADSRKGNLFFSLERPEGDEFGLMRRGGGLQLCRGNQALLPAAELPLSGRHNLANALAALAMGEALGLPMETMLETLRVFKGLPHRTQFVAEKRGVCWYNDSKGTNPGACIAALEGFTHEEGRTVLIAGGVGKGADFSSLGPVVERTARAVVLMGRDAPAIAALLPAGVPAERAATMVEAVELAAGLARPGDRVLLSPACASLDMFDNFAHRGRCFMEAVEGLPS